MKTKTNDDERLTVCEALGATAIVAAAAFSIVAAFGILTACEVYKGIKSRFGRGGG